MTTLGPSSGVEAVIVAGGFGTRLMPLTTHRPKHLLEVGGVPFLEHQIARLAAAGGVHVVVAASYHADLFEPVLGDGRRGGGPPPPHAALLDPARGKGRGGGAGVDCGEEAAPLGRGGGIRNVAGAL